ncbi:unnamed protein product, partial [Mesorhabditis belari]|uniref:CRAL-TRIO domain-containing protein n=1 Tax=Mesorhabditis belari TaxID=2138241 RepID=A0AAF3EPD9_9BILA
MTKMSDDEHLQGYTWPTNISNNNYEMMDKDRKAVEFLRNGANDLLTEYYDTNFNLLRWAQGYGYDLDEGLKNLRKHLKFRRYYDLDEHHLIREHEILKKYFPIGLVGETGHGNTLLVIESAGKIDLMGILRAVQLSDFLIQRARFQEEMLEQMNGIERRTGKQASVIYILDLEGLKFDPSLLQVVTGPYRILWASVYTNYPEWIDHFIMVNVPSFISILWKAIVPFLPERTRNKVKICSAGSDWKQQVLQFAKPEYVPVHWGGTKLDSNGDPMCREILNIPFEPIPSTLYWTPSEESPAIKDLDQVTIPASKSKILTFLVKGNEEKMFFILNRFCDRTFGQGIWYSEDESAIEWPLEEMEEWCPDFDYPGMPTVDWLRIRIPGAGVYKLKFGNEQAWIRSLTIHYRMRFVNEIGELLDFQQIP